MFVAHSSDLNAILTLCHRLTLVACVDVNVGHFLCLALGGSPSSRAGTGHPERWTSCQPHSITRRARTLGLEPIPLPNQPSCNCLKGRSHGRTGDQLLPPPTEASLYVVDLSISYSSESYAHRWSYLPWHMDGCLKLDAAR